MSTAGPTQGAKAPSGDRELHAASERGGHFPAPWIARQTEALLAQRGHAWLLQGPSGLGQYELALALVSAWLCEQPTAQGACGHCPSCHAIEVRTHADLAVLMPETQMMELGWPLSEKAQAEIDDKKRKPSREIRVALDPQRLQALGVTAAEVSRQLRQMQLESAGGRTDLGGSEQPVRTLATVRSAQEIARIEIPLASGRRVMLQDVATITDTVAEPRSAALLDGKPVVGFEVARSKGESEVEVGAGIRRALDELRAAHPGIVLTQAFDFVTPVEEEYDGSMKLLYEGGILAVVVVWLFLRDWRATFVSAVALPMSVIPAFLGMIPTFMIMDTLGWIDQPRALYLPAAAPAMGIFLMRQYIESAIPRELLEAARMDGCGELGIYARIVVPLLGPAFGTLGLITFIASWNNFMGPLIVMRSVERYTFPLALRSVQSPVDTEWGALMAGSVVAVLPLLVIFVLSSRRLIAGLTAGAIKS